jgi:GntR family transcriptional regulator, arabinose operon transcriptional repressor
MTICISKKKYTAKDIATDIEAYIIDTSQKSNTALATSKELAKKYNVSSMTVNRAITTLVEKGLIYRVQGKGTFVAKQTVKKCDKLVGYFAWQHNDHTPLNEAAYGTFENILINKFNELGITVDFVIRPEFCQKTITSFDAIKYDLLIIPSGMITPQTMPWLKRLPVPIIMVCDAKVLEYPFHQVNHYYDLGFEAALNYLKRKKNKNIFIAHVDGETSLHRAAVLRKIADDMGIYHKTLPFKPEMSAATHFAFTCGREQGKYFLDNKLNGVIFALSDFIAFGIIDVVKERNLELGKDVKIISYDNLESRAPFNSGDAVVTSITHPLMELAQQTVKLADDIIENNIKDLAVTKIIKVPARELVIRKSFY